MTSKSPSKHARAKARVKLLRKWWGNAWMGNDYASRDRQTARLDAWKHGMQKGFAAGIKLARRAK